MAVKTAKFKELADIPTDGKTVQRHKRSKCLITLFAIMPTEPDKARETLGILNDLCNGHSGTLHLRKDVYLPDNQKDDLFGTMMAVCDLKEKEMERNKSSTHSLFQNQGGDNEEEDDFWYLELSGKAILYHKHECLIRNVDFIPISSNFPALLLRLGHQRKFSFIQQGATYYVPHYDIKTHIYSIETLFENQTRAPLEKDKQIIEMFIEVKGDDKMDEKEQKLLKFTRLFDHLHWFKIFPSNCKQMN